MINIPFTSSTRYRAFSMEFTAHLDDQYVEMNILTDKGRPITVVCDKSSILSMQNHIKQMVQACPEISTWGSYKDTGGFQDNAAGS
ncbi:MAG: hypothetical protein WC612_04460 [Bdellovibrionales bacterium]|jgi:hypothetical protein